jgi:hypothetical protein
MITKTICSSVVALAVAGVLSGAAPVQAQYNQYQPQYAPYPQQQYAPAQPQYQQQYAPAQPQYQQQYAPAQPQYQQQYAPAQQQYAPQQYAPQASYSQLPDYCSVNNAAAGAATGAVLGGLIGGLAGGGRGAAIGAASGMLFGGLSGSQADAQCQQMAAQIAYQQAAAQQAAFEQQIAAQAARGGQLNLPASAYVPVSSDYKTPSDGHRHRITVKRLNSFSDPASKQVCDNFTRIDADIDGNTSRTASARRCKGPDGQWRDA